MINNINKYLLIITIIFIILFATIIIFYLKEENTAVQKYLNKIQNKINKQNNLGSKIINTNNKVIYENNIIIVEDFLTSEYINYLQKQFDDKQFESKDFIFRKATGINFQQLHESNEYDGLLDLYYSNQILDFLSKVIKKPVQRISLGDPNACSLLIYSKSGDHINWHYDYSNYYGDRFVVLLTLINENADKNDLSDNIFQYNYNGKIHDLKMKENSIIIFKGSEILHKSTPISDYQRRILLSMVYCDICQEKKNVFNIMYETTKNYIVYQS
jgi:hypothetical protein